jgi:ABC-2 type transport system ATP-binding protein
MITPLRQNEVVIQVDRVSKSFKTVQAVKEVSLTIHRGEFVGLLGPNGAGKTTLVEMIEGIQKPDSGEILINGKHWKGHQEEIHKVIGISLQETYFIDKLTVQETLKLFASFYRLLPQRQEEILELTGLQEKRQAYVVNLSGGQRQRLALGIALLNEPQILLLDEPTTGLDPTARKEIWNILMKLQEQRKTSLILTTHYMEEAEFLCDYIILIDKGKILQEGTLQHLLSKRDQDKTLEFTLHGDLGHLKQLPADKYLQIQWDQQQAKGTLLLRNIEKELPQFFNYLKQNDFRLLNLECRRQTLNDLFIALTGRKLDDDIEK